jgi:hypothetical protein
VTGVVSFMQQQEMAEGITRGAAGPAAVLALVTACDLAVETRAADCSVVAMASGRGPWYVCVYGVCKYAVRVCVCVCVCVCTYVCMRVCMYVCMYIYTYVPGTQLTRIGCLGAAGGRQTCSEDGGPSRVAAGDLKLNGQGLLVQQDYGQEHVGTASWVNIRRRVLR